MIRLTKQTDYGIVLLTHMARRPDERFNAPDLAAEARLPLPMVSKILKLLARGEILASQRGVKGGYSLALDAADISVAAIIAALEGPIAITECIESSPDACSYEAHCQVRENWQRINGAVLRALEGITLDEMARPLVLTGPLDGQQLVSIGRESR